MARDYFINGESLVKVKGNLNTTIATLTELGLADGPIRVSPELHHRGIQVDAAGGEVPPEEQYFCARARVSMTLVHFDRDAIDACIRESNGGAGTVGTLSRAGTRMGGGGARFSANWHYVGVNILSPVGNKPWRFLHCRIDGSIDTPLGTEKSTFTINWIATPYTIDPWNNGNGMDGVAVWDHVLDT
jgi:hypothetical protein